ncbi:MAG TPA: hypothetical protein ENJ82_01430 [Bacteroidetes bacterium]|nr:hypothetical protein [Bacteroidota bacterium]
MNARITQKDLSGLVQRLQTIQHPDTIDQIHRLLDRLEAGCSPTKMSRKAFFSKIDAAEMCIKTGTITLQNTFKQEVSIWLAQQS